MPGKTSRTMTELVNDLQCDDRDISEAASKALVASKDASVVDHLIELLKSRQHYIQNRAAGALRDIGDDRAIEPLIAAIKLPTNQGYNGSFIYALQTLDCKHLFSFLFDLVIEGDYEVRCMSLMILEEQEFEVTPTDFTEAKNKLDTYMSRKDLRPEDEHCMQELHTVFVNISNKN